MGRYVSLRNRVQAVGLTDTGKVHKRRLLELLEPRVRGGATEDG